MKESKTPKFDALLDKILNQLVPSTKVCGDCKKEFNIEADDITFYKMFRVPPSKFCPDCRQKRRLAFANYSSIYKRKCDVPGHTEMMISPVAPIMPWKTYDYDVYYGDSWNPFTYGHAADLNQKTFSQISDILNIIPQPGIRRGDNSVNCDFSFYGRNMKDCYYVFGGRKSEDIMFGSSIYRSKHAVDSYSIYDVDTVYQNISTSDCFKINFGYFSNSCVECDFIFDCRNCQNCFGCVNLRNKNYCWFNEQLSREEYIKKRKMVNLGNRKILNEYQKKFWNFVKENPIRATRIMQSHNCSGEDIRESNNCHNCFQLENCENVKYGAFAIVNLRDSMDIGHTGGAEKQYYSQNCGTKSSNIKFSFAMKESMDCEYTMSSKNCTNCFGCVGLRNASYCIFNKKYEPEEYWKILDQVKTKMLADGDYGEFFPMNFSPCAYNSTLAQIIYPINENEAKQCGVYWQNESDIDTRGLRTLSVNEFSENIADIDTTILDVVIIGEKTHQPFKITERELEFYKRHNLALPNDTPRHRMLERFKILNNFRTHNETCSSCGKEIESLFGKKDGFQPYCESCYKKEVI
jgi:hypothetical protein